MSTFVYLVRNAPRENATEHVNEILKKLQQRGAKITSVTASMSHASGSSEHILYVIAYEALGSISL